MLNYVGYVCGGGTNRRTEGDWPPAWERTDDGVDIWAFAGADDWNAAAIVLGASPSAYDMTASVHGTDA